jgi:hypothetical protein
LGRGAGLATFPERRQRVQAEARWFTPPMTVRTDLRFTCHLRLVTLLAWLTRCPDMGIFPQN